MEITENKFKTATETQPNPTEDNEVGEAQFDPNKSYSWSNSTNFSLNGKEFEIVLNAFRMLLSSPEAQAILMCANASHVMETKLLKAANVGEVKVFDKPKQPEG